MRGFMFFLAATALAVGAGLAVNFYQMPDLTEVRYEGAVCSLGQQTGDTSYLKRCDKYQRMMWQRENGPMLSAVSGGIGLIVAAIFLVGGAVMKPKKTEDSAGSANT